MNEVRKLPPVWVLGLTNATFGLFAGFSVITLAEMLAAQGVPGGRIAAIVAAVMSPGFWAFLLAPMLDVRFSRRSYALFFSLIAAVAVGFTVAHPGNPGLIEAVMMGGFVAASLVQGAVGGWMGSLTGRRDDGNLGAWFTVSNFGAGGLMIVLAGEAITHLRPTVAGTLLGGVILLPSLLYLLIPAPGPDRRLASESFGRLFAEILALVRRREVLIALLLFTLPSASFTLTNVLGGLGKDFRANERMVSLLGGFGATLAGVAGSLLLPQLAKRFSLLPLYLGIGVVGAIFTLSLLLLPHVPWVFAIALPGEDLFQALAFAAAAAITFETIGQNNPLASTQFSLLIAATNLPVVYMGFIDGRAYSWRGVSGSLLADAGISLVICLLLVAVLRVVRRRKPIGPGEATQTLVGPPGFEPGTKAL